MNFKTSREEALKILENYVDQDISNYTAQRNFDFGPQSRKVHSRNFLASLLEGVARVTTHGLDRLCRRFKKY